MENQNSRDFAENSTAAAGVERIAAVPVERKVLQMAPPPITPVVIPQMLAVQPEQPPPPSQIIIQKPGVEDALLAAFAALGFAISARVQLFLALVGAFVLAVMAMRALSTPAMITLGLYCGLTVLPLVWLETRAKRKE